MEQPGLRLGLAQGLERMSLGQILALVTVGLCVGPEPSESPASLDAFVFSYLALLLQAKLPSGKLQAHLRGLHNLCAYCTHILSLYFPWDGAEVPPPPQTPAGPETEEELYRRRNQILSVLAGLAAMVGYALLSGIVSIQRATPARGPGTRALGMAEEDEEE
ncbi:Metaxin-1 [Plecturocebus cupreus]